MSDQHLRIVTSLFTCGGRRAAYHSRYDLAGETEKFVTTFPPEQSIDRPASGSAKVMTFVGAL
jgi:hypothetical protein